MLFLDPEGLQVCETKTDGVIPRVGEMVSLPIEDGTTFKDYDVRAVEYEYLAPSTASSLARVKVMVHARSAAPFVDISS